MGANRFPVGGRVRGLIVDIGHVVGAGQTDLVRLFVDEDDEAGDGRTRADHAHREGVQGVLHRQVEDQVRGDARQRRHALLEQYLHARTLGVLRDSTLLSQLVCVA